MLELVDQNHVDAVLVDTPPHEQLANWQLRYDRTAFVVLVDGAVHAGARAILHRSAQRHEIVPAIKAVTNGLLSCRVNSLRRCSTAPWLLRSYSMATTKSASC
jgi:hypothetical protein